MNSSLEKTLYNELNIILKKYSLAEYDPDTVIEIISRALRRKGNTHKEIIFSPDIKPSKVLRLQREKMGYSLTTLAKNTGLAKSNLSAIENGKRQIGLKLAKILAKSLQINYKSLL